ncbi:hypothetical protein D3C76_849910 [compost metagenome]
MPLCGTDNGYRGPPDIILVKPAQGEALLGPFAQPAAGNSLQLRHCLRRYGRLQHFEGAALPLKPVAHRAQIRLAFACELEGLQVRKALLPQLEEAEAGLVVQRHPAGGNLVEHRGQHPGVGEITELPQRPAELVRVADRVAQYYQCAPAAGVIKQHLTVGTPEKALIPQKYQVGKRSAREPLQEPGELVQILLTRRSQNRSLGPEPKPYGEKQPGRRQADNPAPDQLSFP